MRVFDLEVFDREIIDVGHQDADVSPVASLAFSRDARIGSEGALAERFGAVAGRAGFVGPFQQHATDAVDMNVLDRFDVGDPEPTVGAADKIVSAAIGELDVTVVQLQNRVLLHEYR